jgi:hypothetical protein
MDPASPERPEMPAQVPTAEPEPAAGESVAQAGSGGDDAAGQPSTADQLWAPPWLQSRDGLPQVPAAGKVAQASAHAAVSDDAGTGGAWAGRAMAAGEYEHPWGRHGAGLAGWESTQPLGPHMPPQNSGPLSQSPPLAPVPAPLAPLPAPVAPDRAMHTENPPPPPESASSSAPPGSEPLPASGASPPPAPSQSHTADAGSPTVGPPAPPPAAPLTPPPATPPAPTLTPLVSPASAGQPPPAHAAAQEPGNGELGPAQAGQAGASEFANDVIGPPDYFFGPPPGAEAPGVDMPGVSAPGFEATGFEATGFEATGFEATGFDSPIFEPPGFQDPAFEPPDFQAPGFQAPGFQAPGAGALSANGAQQDAPNPGAPDGGEPATAMPGTGLRDTGRTGNGLAAWGDDTTAAINLGLPPGGPPPTLAYPRSGPVPNGHGPAQPTFPDAGQTPGAVPPWPAPPYDGLSTSQAAGPLPPQTGPLPPQTGPLPPQTGPLPPHDGPPAPQAGPLSPHAWAFAPQAGPVPPPPGPFAPQLSALPPPPGTLPGQAGSFPPAAGLNGQAFPGQPPNTTEGSDRTFPPSGRRPSSKKILAITVAVAALAVAAGAFVVLRSHPAKRTTQAPPSAASPTGPASLASKIDSVATDPKPITRAEIFPASHITADGRQFVRVATAVNRNCALSARGAFAAALMASNCERVVRATYVDTSKRIVVTAGVAALPTKAAAERVNRAKRLKRNIWFAGLNGKPGSGAQMISVTGGYAYGLVDGRYIIFAYATYTNGQTPTGKAALDRVVASVSRSFALLAQQPITARAQRP